MNTLRNNFTLYRLLSVGDERLAKVADETYRSIQPTELRSLVDALGLPRNPILTVSQRDMAVQTVLTQPLYTRSSVSQLDVEGTVLAFHCINDGRVIRPLLQYMASHLDMDLDDPETLDNAVSSVLWQSCLNHGPMVTFDASSHRLVRSLMKWIDSMLQYHRHDHVVAGIKSASYDSRTGWLIFHFTEYVDHVIETSQ